jgi:hypothetical protein
VLGCGGQGELLGMLDLDEVGVLFAFDLGGRRRFSFRVTLGFIATGKEQPKTTS